MSIMGVDGQGGPAAIRPEKLLFDPGIDHRRGGARRS